MFTSPESIRIGQPADSLETKPADSSEGKSSAIWWSLLAVLLIANIPLLICMPLTADPITYDLQAKTALEGGVLYRDIVEPNLPGVVWVHMAVRSVLGWSTYALRAFDLLVVAGIVGLLLGLSCLERRSFAERKTNIDAERKTNIDAERKATIGAEQKTIIALLVLLSCWFYFSMSEWTHCQRDIWMLLPALAAVHFRVRFHQRLLTKPLAYRSVFLWGSFEGLIWGAAFWIKPMVAVPAVCCLLVSLFVGKGRKPVWIHLVGVIAGGMICGAIGSAWLIATGAWPYFWKMALEWNPEYLASGGERWSFPRYQSLIRRFMPWIAVHLVAMPLAIREVISVRKTSSERLPVCLLAGCYLGWLIQAHFLQHLLDYVHVPAILLGMGLIAASWLREKNPSPLRPLLVGGLIVLALPTSPATNPSRLAWWGKCWTQGSTPEVRAGLQLVPMPDWKELDQVAEFLRAENVKDGEVTAYNVFTIHVYPELDLAPSTRYVFPEVHLRLFKSRAALIENALNQSRQRYVVSSLLENGMRPEDIDKFNPETPPALPAAFPEEELATFPYNQELVFRAGQYVVHKTTKPVGPLDTTFFPLRREETRGEERLVGNR